ncbi:MAG: hypothetical protein QUS33_07770 [Dehalococcoidia bacterium]|nr:hypothetical protein [Dehalococcoidia bacterium]
MAKKANISGLAVFFVGIALLLVTFIVALLAFINPDRVGGFGDLIPAPEGDWEGVVVALGYLVALGLLMVLGWVAGKITAMGIKMFKARPSSETNQEG